MLELAAGLKSDVAVALDVMSTNDHNG